MENSCSKTILKWKKEKNFRNGFSKSSVRFSHASIFQLIFFPKKNPRNFEVDLFSFVKVNRIHCAFGCNKFVFLKLFSSTFVKIDLIFSFSFSLFFSLILSFFFIFFDAKTNSLGLLQNSMDISLSLNVFKFSRLLAALHFLIVPHLDVAESIRFVQGGSRSTGHQNSRQESRVLPRWFAIAGQQNSSRAGALQGMRMSH